MSDFIPDEVLHKILSCLPPKSLVRFTSVCKSWQSLITSSDFITDHLNQTKLSNDRDDNHLLLLRYYPGKPEKERYSLRVDNETFDEYQTLDFLPFETFELYFRVLGSCNGLICLSDDYCGKKATYILWNPSVRKSLKLPVPRFTYQTHGPYDDMVGFGFDSRNNDYKVVRLVYLEGKSPRVEIFKLSTGRWETIVATIKPSYIVYYHWNPVFLNGAAHWSAYDRGNCNVIIAFDMSDELFRVIKLPPKPSDAECEFVMQMPVAVCGEWLSFFHYSTKYPESCSIWVMKEYGNVESWSKLYTLDVSGGLSHPLCFRINGDVITAITNNEFVRTTMKNNELVSYDPHTQKIKYLGVCDSKKKLRQLDMNEFSFFVGAYVESLVLLGYKPWAEPVMQEERKRKDKSSKKNRAGAIMQL